MAGLSASGAYLLSAHLHSADAGPYAVERFTCGEVDGSWRYDAVREHPGTGARLGRLELLVDERSVRLHVEAGGWVLRGAAAGGEVLWRRGSEERSAAGDGFTGSSPAHLVALSRRPAGLLQLVEVTEPVLATRLVQRSWAPGGSEDRDGVRVDAHDLGDLATGERARVHLAGDVVVAAPGVRLTALTRS